MLAPVRNAIPLCADCHHGWFDKRKMMDLIWNPLLRVFTAEQESFTFLVEKCGYTWGGLEILYRKHLNVMKYGTLVKAALRQELTEVLDNLKAAA